MVGIVIIVDIDKFQKEEVKCFIFLEKIVI